MHVSISKNVTRRTREPWKKRGMEDDQQSQRSQFMQMLHSRLFSLRISVQMCGKCLRETGAREAKQTDLAGDRSETADLTSRGERTFSCPSVSPRFRIPENHFKDFKTVASGTTSWCPAQPWSGIKSAWGIETLEVQMRGLICPTV